MDSLCITKCYNTGTADVKTQKISNFYQQVLLCINKEGKLILAFKRYFTIKLAKSVIMVLLVLKPGSY